MKRFRLWARSFSLTQQFISLLFILSLVLVIGLATLVWPNIHFSASQDLQKTFATIETAIQEAKADQQSTLYLPWGSYVYEKEGTTWRAYSKNEPNLYRPDQYHQKLVKIDGQEYRIYIDKEAVPDVEKRVGESLNIINMLVLGLFMMAMLIWLSSLIYRLHRIRVHIRHVKLNEPSPLKITHHDEIGAVSEALVEMEETLSKQSREKEEMIQNISHDLKTPIATIKSYAEAIQDGVYPYGTLEESVAVVQDHADRLEKKVKSLLLLNRYGYLAEQETNALTNLAPLIDSVVISLKAIRCDIEFKVDSEDVHFKGEEEPWRNVISNLLDNALRYAKSEIRIDLKNNELRIENDGPTIPKEDLSKLFDPYVKGKDGQFGLGLAIVDRVSQGYGYRVRVYNTSDGVGFEIKGKEIRTKV